MENNRNRYSALLPEEGKRRYESNRQWYNRQSPEKKAKMKEKQKKYNKSRFHNLMVKIQ